MADENKNAQQAPKFDEDAAVVEQEIGRFPVDKVPQELLDAYHITPEMLAEIKPGTHTVYTYAQVRVGVRKGYILRKVGEAYMVMPTGPRMKEYRGMITLNETGAFLFKESQKPEPTRDKLALIADMRDERVIRRAAFRFESAASGLVAGVSLAREMRGLAVHEFPTVTALGALGRHVCGPNRDYQPMSITFGIIDEYPERIRNKVERYEAIARRSLETLETMKEEFQ